MAKPSALLTAIRFCTRTVQSSRGSRTWLASIWGDQYDEMGDLNLLDLTLTRVLSQDCLTRQVSRVFLLFISPIWPTRKSLKSQNPPVVLSLKKRSYKQPHFNIVWTEIWLVFTIVATHGYLSSQHVSRFSWPLVSDQYPTAESAYQGGTTTLRTKWRTYAVDSVCFHEQRLVITPIP